jgi:GNAT superfamily N-acetyltransferase
LAAVRVRPAVAEDVPRVAEVHVLGWQVGYRGLLPQRVLDGLRPAQRVPRWTETVRRADWPSRGTLVADEAGDVIGFADLRPTHNDDQDPAEVGEIASFYVLPDAWGHGVGRHLMAGSVDALRAAGFASASLWVLDTNARAIRFYARSGWEPDGAVRGDVVGDAEIQDVRCRRPLR